MLSWLSLGKLLVFYFFHLIAGLFYNFVRLYFLWIYKIYVRNTNKNQLNGEIIAINLHFIGKKFPENMCTRTLFWISIKLIPIQMNDQLYLYWFLHRYCIRHLQCRYLPTLIIYIVPILYGISWNETFQGFSSAKALPNEC